MEGVYFSVPPIIVNSVHFQELVKKVPLTRLLTETDAPWMAPVKGEINEPANVAVTVKEIAKIKGITVEECTKAIYAKLKALISKHGLYRSYSLSKATKSSVFLEDLKLPTGFVEEIKK